MERRTLINEIRSEINQIIKEEKTINDSVMQCTKEVEEYIMQNIKNAEIIETYNGGAKRCLTFSHMLFSEDGKSLKCSINVENYNFKNQQFFKLYNQNHDFDLECKSVYRKIGNKDIAMVIIKYISINFEPLSKFYQDVPHEINHIFQQYMDGQTYPDFTKYSKTITDMYKGKTQELRNVSYLLYLLHTTEQDSFVISAYNYVKHHFFNMEKTIDSLLKETEVFQNIVKCKEMLNEIINNKENYQNIITKELKFKDFNTFKRRILSLIKRYERKFAMLTIKCKNDFMIYETHTSYRGTLTNVYFLS